MKNTLDVIFLAKDDPRPGKQIEDLSHLGFKVHRYDELHEIYDQLERLACPLIVLDAPLPDIHIAMVRLRGINRALGIVALAPFADSESRIRTLLCGADACLTPDVSGLELAAVLQALIRRSGTVPQLAAVSEPTSSPALLSARPYEQSAGWRLLNKGWTLVSPAGRSLGLTTGERDFLARLFLAPDRKLSRATLYPEILPDQDTPSSRRRPVDVMISRLRRKALQNQMELPIRAVHGMGYMFTGEVCIASNDQHTEMFDVAGLNLAGASVA